jgi:uncharacterized protein (TIGR02001 family)
LAFFCVATPASADVGATVSLFSDARFRGYSLSEGHPVGILDLSYDDVSGFYAAGSASAVIFSNGPRPLGLQLGGGYATRLSPSLSADLGVIHSRYSGYSSHGSANSYTEIYAGLTHGFLSARVAYSPHYFEHGARTIYGEVDANVGLARKLRLNGHFGLLAPIDYQYRGASSRTQYDWRVGVTREIGRASLHLVATGGGPGCDYYRGRYHSRTALTFGASLPL